MFLSERSVPNEQEVIDAIQVRTWIHDVQHG